MTQLNNLHQIPARPAKTELAYDVLETEDGRYSIYIAARYTDLETGTQSQTLYHHGIDPSGN